MEGLGSAGVSEGVPPVPSIFEDLGVAPIDRCTGAELRALWYTCDTDRNDVLDAGELSPLLEMISARWGDGRWKQGISY